MTHLTMDALVSLREPGNEPGQSAAREHLKVVFAAGAHYAESAREAALSIAKGISLSTTSSLPALRAK